MIKSTMKKFLFVFICLIITGCATYTGDKLIELTSLPAEPENHENLLKVAKAIDSLYDELQLPDERKIPLDDIHNYDLILEKDDIKFAREKQKVFLIKGNIHVSHCHNSIIIARGNIDISHGSNNILISGNNVNISHDRGGSIVVARGKTDISFANNTTIYSTGDLKISHPRNVISLNTDKRKTSWVHINNILIDPLFEFEESFNK